MEGRNRLGVQEDLEGLEGLVMRTVTTPAPVMKDVRSSGSGPSIAGKTLGTCFPENFGGACHGTPTDCKDCNKAISCYINFDKIVYFWLNYILYLHNLLPKKTCRTKKR